jgi:hypothetical protein
MDILERLAVEVPCSTCGGRYEVTIKQVLLSQEMLHEGCPVQNANECPPLAYSELIDSETIKDLQRIWARLEEKLRGAGGEIKLRCG